MHAHWLPGLDDGAKTMAESLGLLRGLADLGYRKLIATPHVMADLYPNTPEEIRSRLAEVKVAAAKAGIDLELDAAAEYLLDDKFPEKLEAGDLLTLPGRRVLVEFSFALPPVRHEEIFFSLLTKNYVPVLAHPERYAYWHGELDQFQRFHERGVELQVNALSLGGYYGKSVRKAARQLFDRGIVSFIGSDAHHERHIAAYTKFLAQSSVRKFTQRTELRNLALH